MQFKKIEEALACSFNKIDNRKTRIILHEENLLNREREREILSKNIRLERIQILLRLKKKLENRRKMLPSVKYINFTLSNV